MDNLLHTFSVDVYSEQDAMRYAGTFTTKKLTIKTMTQLGVRRSQLCGGLHYDEENPGQGLDATTYSINSMIAHLEVSLVDVPAWWDLDRITDISVLSEVYKEVALFESNFSRSRNTAKDGRPAASSQGSSQAQGSGSDAGGEPQPVVGGEVQASLEP